eukprot:2394722-Prymnesium_polylepis.1
MYAYARMRAWARLRGGHLVGQRGVLPHHLVDGGVLLLQVRLCSRKLLLQVGNLDLVARHLPKKGHGGQRWRLGERTR